MLFTQWGKKIHTQRHRQVFQVKLLGAVFPSLRLNFDLKHNHFLPTQVVSNFILWYDAVHSLFCHLP